MKSTKKILSFTVVVCMLISLLPTFTVTASDSEFAYAKYVFTNTAVGDSNTRISWGDGYTDASGKSLSDINSDISAPWDLLAYRYAHGAGYDGNGFWYRTKSGMDVTIPKAANNGFAFEITVPKDGIYEPKINFDYANNGGTVSVYVIDKATVDSLGYNMQTTDGIYSVVYNQTAIGTFDNYDADAQSASFDKEGNATLDEVKLKGGSNYLVFSMTDKSPKAETGPAQLHIEIRSFEIQEVIPSKTTYVFTNTAVGDSNTGNIIWGTDYADNSGKTLSDIVDSISAPWDLLAGRCIAAARYNGDGFWYRTNEQVTNVGANGVAFEITVPADGMYQPIIDFDYAQMGGTVSVYVLDKATVKSLSYDMTTQSGVISIVRNQTPIGTFDNYDANANRGGDFDKKGSKTLEPLKLKGGSNYLVFSMTGKGATATENPSQPHVELRSLTLEKVVQKSAKYVFNCTAVGAAADSISWGSSKEEMSGKTLSDINPAISDPWDLLAFRAPHGAKYDANGMWYRTNESVSVIGNNGMSFEITVPADGVYDATLTFDYTSQGGIVSMYMFDKATIANKNYNMATQSGIISITQNEKAIGTFDSYDANTSATGGFDKPGTVTFEGLELKSGSNYLVFSMTDKSPLASANPTQPHIELRSLEINIPEENDGGEEEEDVPVLPPSKEFVFSSAAIGVSDGTVLSQDTNGSDTSGKALSDIVLSESMPWDILAFGSLSSGTYFENGISYGISSDTVGKDGTNGIAFKISVPKSATYRPCLTYDRGNLGGIVSAYIFDEATVSANGFDMTTRMGIESAVKNLSPVAVFDTFDTDFKSGEIDGLAEIIFPEGEYTEGDYYLVFSITDKNEAIDAEASSCFFELSSLKLREVPTASANYVFSNAAVGDTATRISNGTDGADPSGKTLSDNNPDVSDPWDLLAFRSHHGAGYDATGFWFRTKSGLDVKTPGINGVSFEIVVPKEGYYRPTLSFDYAVGGKIVSVYMFGKSEAEVRGFNMATQSGIIATTQGMAPIGTYDSFDLAGANAGFDMMGVTTLPPVKLSEGSNYLVFAMTDLSPKDDVDAQPHLEIRSLYLEQIAEEDVDTFIYDFKSYTNNAGVGTIKNYSMTKNWKYGSFSPSLLERYNASAATVRMMQPYGIQAQTMDGEWMALTLNVEKPGFYIPDFTNMVSTTGGAADVYLAPAEVAEADRFDEKYSLGEVEFGAYETAYNVKTALRGVMLDKAGEYVLILKAKQSEITGNCNMYPTSLTLTKTDITGAKLVYDYDYIRAGATENIVLEINTASGREVTLAGAKITYSGDNDSVATIDQSGNICGISEGKVSFSVTVEIGDKKFVDSIDILVKELTYTEAMLNLADGEVIYEGGKKVLSANAAFNDGTVAKPGEISVRYESDNPGIAEIVNGEVTAISEGEANITAYVTLGGVEKSVTKRIKVEAVSLSSISAKTEDAIVSSLDADGSPIIVSGHNNDGSDADITGATFTYECLTPETVIVDDSGNVYYVSRGEGEIKVTANINGLSLECVCKVTSSSEKTEPTIYTNEMRETALKNAAKHDWARDLVKTAKNDADKYVDNVELIYELIPAEGVPRGLSLTTVNAPAEILNTCPYCKINMSQEYGSYAWIVNPIRNPWKIQCPECKRLFPSNDFELLYKRGLDENGEYNHELAKKNNAEAVANGEKDALRNDLYRDVATALGVPADKVDTWMVDDGFGWSPVDMTYGTTTLPKFTPVGYYAHYFWDRNGSDNSFLSRALNDLRDAYLYTGDAKYGRAGAILIDRVADVYPGFDLSKYSQNYSNSHGGRRSGKTVGSIWETYVLDSLIRAYDAFYPMMDDTQVISFLSMKAAEKGLKNPKTTGDMIRENCETGILREAFKGAQESKVIGNFGMHQLNVALAAVGLDIEEETREMFDWLGRESKFTTASVTDQYYGNAQTVYTGNSGGEMLIKYIRDVDRDGFGNEVGIGYNRIWVINGIDIAELIYRYGAESDLNLFENPKYVKMFNSIIKETLGNGYSIQLGDSGGTATTSLYSTADETLRAFNMLKDPQLAKNYYYSVGGEIDDVYIDMFTDNDNLKTEILDAIETYGELEFESENLTGFGLGILRGGNFIKSAGVGNDAESRYDVWMSYGITNQSHAHKDMLQLGIDAYGFNMTPDLGYPEATGNSANRMQWVNNTISHNTVVVNDAKQLGVTGGNPLHFDDVGKVKVIDVDAPNAYAETSIYRRTAVTVEKSADVAYTVDFFRIKGGSSHTYSFHTQGYKGYTTDDLTLVPQTDDEGNYIGTYAGRDVPYGADPNTPEGESADCITKYPRGYTWLTEVDRAENIESGNFSVNFSLTDYNRQVSDSKDLNLKFTAVNDWTPSGIGLMTGYPPRTAGHKHIPGLDYMLIHRTGKSLDTLFTSVIQPYKGEEYIRNISAVSADIKNGVQEKNDVVKALKVELTNGRCDYIIYATNNSVTYTVKDGENEVFDFRGFVGVYSVNEAGEKVYSYINDGDIIGESETVGTYTGKVVDFTTELTDKNSITVRFDGDVDLEKLINRYIYVENDGVQNGAYRILDAEADGGNVVLHLGNTSLIRGFVKVSDLSLGYTYNIEKDQKFRIPLSEFDDNAPVFSATNKEVTATAGSSISLTVTAESPVGQTVTYKGTVLPRGASIDEVTGKITWKPASSQIGENGFLITAVDEDGRESTVSFEATVYGSTSGPTGSGTTPPTPGSGTDTPAPGTGTDKPGNDGTGTIPGGSTGTGISGGNGGSGGDGTATTPTIPDKPETPDETVRFIDLGNHAWAADAINALAEDGIIRGTSENTFSPANNITRADFAILLVRAFEKTSDNTENFDDVLVTDYFAPELAIARNTGLVDGIGDNKFAPHANIKRCDMMLMLYRVLSTLSVSFADSSPKVRAEEYADFTDVPDYAKEAVSALVSAELVNGKDNKIAPNDNTTRAEVAVLLKRVLDFIAAK